MDLTILIESLLFISGKPISLRRLSDIVGKDKKQVAAAVQTLMEQYNTPDRGIHIQQAGSSYQMATNPECAYLIKEFVKAEQSGELTKPSLETLTIIAYRGPVTKAELEQIRGVNCSLIIRNLMIKGLIEASEDREKMATVYTVTFDFLRFLGADRVEDLPNYEALRHNENIRTLLEESAGRDESANMPSAEAESDAAETVEKTKHDA